MRSERLAKFFLHLSRYFEKKCINSLPKNRISDEFTKVKFSKQALQKLIKDFDFETVLDIGSGAGTHAQVFKENGKKVTCIDYGQSSYFDRKPENIKTIVGDFNEYDFDTTFDCIWCSHILEHQLNPHEFLVKVHKDLKEGGIIAITVPPRKDEIVGGHVTLWNAGLLLYHLVLAGFDCQDASVLRYGYNISVIVKKKSVNVMDKISYDNGDIKKISKFLPRGLSFNPGNKDKFDGFINKLNW